MVNQNITYDEDVKAATNSVYEALKTSKFDVSLRLGDVYGPERTAMSIQVNLKKRYVLCDYNSKFWRIGFFRADDEEGSGGISFVTSISDTYVFSNWFVDFLDRLV